MSEVRFWLRVTLGKGPDFNEMVRGKGSATKVHDPSPIDSVKVKTWSLSLPESGPHNGMWSSWPMTREEADDLEKDMISLAGAYNKGNPGTTHAGYRSDEEEVAEGEPPTQTKAPHGGWNNDNVLGDDGVRSNEACKVRSEAP